MCLCAHATQTSLIGRKPKTLESEVAPGGRERKYQLRTLWPAHEHILSKTDHQGLPGTFSGTLRPGPERSQFSLSKSHTGNSNISWTSPTVIFLCRETRGCKVSLLHVVEVVAHVHPVALSRGLAGKTKRAGVGPSETGSLCKQTTAPAAGGLSCPGLQPVSHPPAPACAHCWFRPTPFLSVLPGWSLPAFLTPMPGTTPLKKRTNTIRNHLHMECKIFHKMKLSTKTETDSQTDNRLVGAKRGGGHRLGVWD